MRRRCQIAMGVLVATLLALGAPAAATAAAPPSGGPSSAPAGKTSAAAADLCRRIEATVARGDPSVLTGAIDEAAIVDKGLEGLDAPPAIRNQAITGGLARGFGQALVNMVRQGDSYRFLRLRDVGGEPRALFRLFGNDGLNYHDLHLAPTGPSGALRIVDADIYITGETLSRTMRRSLLPITADQQPGRLAQLLAGDSEYIKHLNEVGQFHQAISAGKDAEALRIYDAMPEVLKKNKLLMICHLNAVRNADHANYRAAIDEFRKQFPDDPGALLVTVDALLLRGQYDQALAVVDQIDRKIGGDPLLDLYRSNVAIKQNEVATANRLLDRVIAAEPTVKQPYFARIELALHAKDHATVARLLTAAERHAGVRWENLEKVPVYADFVRSPEYATWVKQHVARPATEPAGRPSAPAD